MIMAVCGSLACCRIVPLPEIVDGVCPACRELTLDAAGDGAVLRKETVGPTPPEKASAPRQLARLLDDLTKSHNGFCPSCDDKPCEPSEGLCRSCLMDAGGYRDEPVFPKGRIYYGTNLPDRFGGSPE